MIEEVKKILWAIYELQCSLDDTEMGKYAQQICQLKDAEIRKDAQLIYDSGYRAGKVRGKYECQERVIEILDGIEIPSYKSLDEPYRHVRRDEFAFAIQTIKQALKKKEGVK